MQEDTLFDTELSGTQFSGAGTGIFPFYHIILVQYKLYFLYEKGVQYEFDDISGHQQYCLEKKKQREHTPFELHRLEMVRNFLIAEGAYDLE